MTQERKPRGETKTYTCKWSGCRREFVARIAEGHFLIMTDDTQERKHTPGPDIVIKALESAKAAVWDSHYGKGIDVGYAQNVSAEIDAAIAHTVTAVNAYEPMLEQLKFVTDTLAYLKGEDWETIKEARKVIAVVEGKEGGAGE